MYKAVTSFMGDPFCKFVRRKRVNLFERRKNCQNYILMQLKHNYAFACVRRWLMRGCQK